jgi:tRNA G18 (ribose-2'-O)-methylase SpoU
LAEENPFARGLAAGFQGGSHILKPLKWYAALHTSKGRAAANAFLVEGYRTIGQIVQNAPRLVGEIIYAQGMRKLDDANISCRILAPAQFRQIALSQHPAGPLAVVALPHGWNSSDIPAITGDRLLILEDVQDPGNIGSLVRSAAAFDFSGIILSEKCADPFAPKSTQASCGAIVSLWLRRTRRYRDLLRTLRERGFRVLAADTGGREWNSSDASSGKRAIVLGNEGAGLTEETMGLADEIVRIPFNDQKVESLNVAASGAICMYLSTLDSRG